MTKINNSYYHQYKILISLKEQHIPIKIFKGCFINNVYVFFNLICKHYFNLNIVMGVGMPEVVMEMYVRVIRDPVSGETPVDV